MTSNKKQGSNWRLLLVGVVLGSVITAGAFWITPLDFNKAKNSINNKVKNINWGFGETKVITTNTERNEQGKVIKITESEQTKSGKTVWDWLELGGTLAVPMLIFIFGLWFQQRENKRADKQDAREREIAQDNLADEAIQAYLKSIGDILLNEEHRKRLLADDNSVRHVARALTIKILRRLEGDIGRQKGIINFLRDTKLYKFILENAYLQEINLNRAYLYKANFKNAKLWKAQFKEAKLQNADLQNADLQDADLQDARLEGADLRNAKLGGQTCRMHNFKE